MSEKDSLPQGELMEASRIAMAEDTKEAPTDPKIVPDSSKIQQPVTLQWDGPKDVDNPMNWPAWKKAFHAAIPAIHSFALTVAASTYVSAIPFVMQQFDISRTVALLPISLYCLGLTIGPIITGPLSELYGRRIIYWTTLPMLMIFNAIAAAGDNLAVLIIFRFLAGVGGSGVLAIGAGTIADLFDAKTAGPIIVTYILAPFLGPCLGPLIGTYTMAQYDNDWKYSIWVVLFICAPVALAMVLMKETSASRILYLRAKERDTVGAEGSETVLDMKKIRVEMIKPLYMCLFEPLTVFLSIYSAFSYAVIFSFFASYNYVYSTVYHFNRKEISLTFLGLVVGFILAVVTFGFFDATLYKKESIRTNGKAAPEHRLYAAMFGSLLSPIGLFWYAWTPRESVHWAVPVLAGVPFGWGTFAVFLSIMTYLVDTYVMSDRVSAVAATGILRYSWAAAFPLFSIQMYEGIGIHWAGSIFAFASLALIPVPWYFFWNGKELRKRSRYQTNEN